jgi:hypothetical protein
MSELPNYEQVWQDFWKEICTKPDGSLDVEQVKKELADYHGIMGEVATVYDTLTMGHISKPNTKASAVISEVQAIQQRELDENWSEAYQEGLGHGYSNGAAA